MIAPEELMQMVEHLEAYAPAEQRHILSLVEQLHSKFTVIDAQEDLIAFCKAMQSDYITGKHHRILADLLMNVATGDKDRVCVNIPPRHGKSQLISLYYPAWFIGRNKNQKLLMASHTTDFAVDFGRKVRNLIASPAYQAIFPGVNISKDSKSAGRWTTTNGCEYYACGVGSALAGRGADLLLIDDPHTEQDLLNGNFDALEKTYSWFTYGARTRLMPGGRVAIVHTRWHKEDLTGRLTHDMATRDDADQYEIVEFPAILETESTDAEGNTVITPKPLWPEFFDLPALYRTKASMPVFQWNAQYQQNPTSEEAAIVKREWWRQWPSSKPPACEYIIMSVDAAAEAKTRANFTALTTWGVFFNEEEDCNNIILLNAIKERLEFPGLKELAIREYNEWEPDSFIVEKKSNGVALYQELRRMGIPVSEYTPHRGSGDKTARLNSVADIVRSGLCWIPDTRWAEELIEEIAAFPFAKNDDQVDSTVLALMRFRQGGFLRLPSDEKEDPVYFKSSQRRYY